MIRTALGTGSSSNISMLLTLDIYIDLLPYQNSPVGTAQLHSASHTDLHSFGGSSFNVQLT